MEHTFYISFSKLRERFDPSVYRARFEYISKIFPNVKLSEIAYIDPATYFDKNPRDMPISFVPMDSINAIYGTIESQQTITISQSKGYTRFQEGDLLWAKITPCMQNGKSAIAHNLVNGLGCGSTEFFVIRPKDGQIVLSEYLYILLRNDKVLQGATNFFGGSAGQQRVSPIFLRDFIIPLPDIAVQQDIIETYFKALTLKRQQEDEADKLIQSIDDYLLSELWIDRPSEVRTENGRFFYTSYRDVVGKRLDPVAHSEQTRNIRRAILLGKYPCVLLKSLMIQDIAGEWGLDVVDDYDTSSYSKCLVLRSTEFNADNNLVIDETKAKYRLINNKKLLSIDLQPNDLIIEKSGGSENQPVGRVAIITKELFDSHKLCYSNFVQKIRIDANKINPMFAYHFLRLVHNLRLTETMQSQTNGIRNLILAEYYSQQIPLPPIDKQEEIILHIKDMYKKAIELQNEANAILVNAKQEIERLIMG